MRTAAGRRGGHHLRAAGPAAHRHACRPRPQVHSDPARRADPPASWPSRSMNSESGTPWPVSCRRGTAMVRDHGIVRQRPGGSLIIAVVWARYGLCARHPSGYGRSPSDRRDWPPPDGSRSPCSDSRSMPVRSPPILRLPALLGDGEEPLARVLCAAALRGEPGYLPLASGRFRPGLGVSVGFEDAKGTACCLLRDPGQPRQVRHARSLLDEDPQRVRADRQRQPRLPLEVDSERDQHPGQRRGQRQRRRRALPCHGTPRPVTAIMNNGFRVAYVSLRSAAHLVSWCRVDSWSLRSTEETWLSTVLTEM